MLGLPPSQTRGGRLVVQEWSVSARGFSLVCMAAAVAVVGAVALPCTPRRNCVAKCLHRHCSEKSGQKFSSSAVNRNSNKAAGVGTRARGSAGSHLLLQARQHQAVRVLTQANAALALPHAQLAAGSVPQECRQRQAATNQSKQAVMPPPLLGSPGRI